MLTLLTLVFLAGIGVGIALYDFILSTFLFLGLLLTELAIATFIAFLLLAFLAIIN